MIANTLGKHDQLREVERIDSRYIIYISGIYEDSKGDWYLKIGVGVFQNDEMHAPLDSGTLINPKSGYIKRKI